MLLALLVLLLTLASSSSSSSSSSPPSPAPPQPPPLLLSSSLTIHHLHAPPLSHDSPHASPSPHVARLQELRETYTRRVASPPTSTSTVALGDSYTFAILSVAYDEPLFVHLVDGEGRASSTSLAEWASSTDNAQRLAGLVRLECGSSTFGSVQSTTHSPWAKGRTAQERLIREYVSGGDDDTPRLPETLSALYGCEHRDGLCWLANAAASGVSPSAADEYVLPPKNEFRAILLLEYHEASGEPRVLHHRGDLLDSACHLHFDELPGLRVGGSTRARVLASPVRLEPAGAPPPLHKVDASSRVMTRAKQYHLEWPSPDLSEKRSSIIAQVVADNATRARGASFLEEQVSTDLNVQSKVQTFEFLRHLAFIRNMEEIRADVAMDVMAEPFIQMLIPIAVKVTVAALKKLVIQAILNEVKNIEESSDYIDLVVEALTPASVEGLLETDSTSHKNPQAVDTGHMLRKAMREALDDKIPAAVVKQHKEHHRARRRDTIGELETVNFVETASGKSPGITSPTAFTDTALAGLSPEVSAGVGLQVFHALSLAAGDSVLHGVNRSVSRQVTRALVTSLTMTLTSTMSHMVSDDLHRSLTHLPTQYVTRPLIPMLTHSLALTVSQALSRKPQFDYFCHYCLADPVHLYCKYCAQGVVLHQALDHYVGYYAAYFGKYYDLFYGNEYADRVAHEFVQGHPFPNPHPAAQIQKYEMQEPKPTVH